ncbi:hypothetical protein [Microvirga puerhi]|uniref:Uncharacterized protein n=1 Tax=Microvirga puerhi TaxID=2876078 RepID=A0ABS7VJ15_9HYPH|nr:hypothetical protein [Microvirga puerhi]MBZ6075482.1 hypothetical protein [Microvirga puerhi]
MKKLMFVLVAGAFSTTAFAQDTTTTIKKEDGLLGSKTTIERKTEPSDTSTSVTTTGSVGCNTEVKQKTNEFGDTKTTKKTEC